MCVSVYHRLVFSFAWTICTGPSSLCDLLDSPCKGMAKQNTGSAVTRPCVHFLVTREP